jgi:hypothetical protein
MRIYIHIYTWLWACVHTETHGHTVVSSPGNSRGRADASLNAHVGVLMQASYSRGRADANLNTHVGTHNKAELFFKICFIIAS